MKKKPYSLTLSLCLYVCVTHSLSHSPFPVRESDFTFNPISKPLLLLIINLLSFSFSLSSSSSVFFFFLKCKENSFQSAKSTVSIFRILLVLCGSLDRDPLLNPHSGRFSFWGFRSLCSVHFKSLLASVVFQCPPFHGILTTLLPGNTTCCGILTWWLKWCKNQFFVSGVVLLSSCLFWNFKWDWFGYLFLNCLFVACHWIVLWHEFGVRSVLDWEIGRGVGDWESEHCS